MSQNTEEYVELMRHALKQAEMARDAGDHPYGSALVGPRGTIFERNRVVSGADTTAHSEVMAIREGARLWGIDELTNTTLVTSYEPCPMCFSAIANAGVTTLVISQRRRVGDAPYGDYSVESLLALFGREDEIAVVSGVLGEEVGAFYTSIDD